MRELYGMTTVEIEHDDPANPAERRYGVHIEN